MAKENHPTKDHQSLMRVDQWQAFESEFIPGAKERQEKGEGFKKS